MSDKGFSLTWERDAIAKKVRQAAVAAVDEVAADIVEEAKANAPVDEGDLPR